MSKINVINIQKGDDLKIFTCEICQNKVSRNESHTSCIFCGQGICKKCWNKLNGDKSNE